jgi:hypothetical protein
MWSDPRDEPEDDEVHLAAYFAASAVMIRAQERMPL